MEDLPSFDIHLHVDDFLQSEGIDLLEINEFMFAEKMEMPPLLIISQTEPIAAVANVSDFIVN